MKQKTAIRQLIDEVNLAIRLWQDPTNEMDGLHALNTILLKAQKLESVNEQQIKDACAFGKRSMDKNIRPEDYVSTKRYFDKTFEKPMNKEIFHPSNILTAARFSSIIKLP